MKAGMWSVPVVMMQPERQMLGPVLGRVISPRIGLFPQGGLDEPLGLAVGLRGIGLGAQVAQSKALADPSEAPGFVAGAVISQNPPEGDAKLALVAQGRQ